MNYLKSFKNIFSKSPRNDEGYFYGIDISDMCHFDFIWSNRPFISDYRDKDGNIGSAKKRINVGKLIEKCLKENGIDGEVSRSEFRSILVEEGFTISRDNDGAYSVEIIGNANKFFNVIKNLRYFLQ